MGWFDDLFDDAYDKSKEILFSADEAVSSFFDNARTTSKQTWDAINNFSEDVVEDLDENLRPRLDDVTEPLLAGTASAWSSTFGAASGALDWLGDPQPQVTETPSKTQQYLSGKQREWEGRREQIKEMFPDPDTVYDTIAEGVVQGFLQVAGTTGATILATKAGVPVLGASLIGASIGGVGNLFANTSAELSRLENEDTTIEERKVGQAALLRENSKFLPLTIGAETFLFSKLFGRMLPKQQNTLSIAQKAIKKQRLRNAVSASPQIAVETATEGWQEVYEHQTNKEVRNKIQREWTDFGNLMPRPWNWTDDEWDTFLIGGAVSLITTAGITTATAPRNKRSVSNSEVDQLIGKINARLAGTDATVEGTETSQRGKISFGHTYKEKIDALQRVIALATVKRNGGGKPNILETSYAGMQIAPDVIKNINSNKMTEPVESIIAPELSDLAEIVRDGLGLTSQRETVNTRDPEYDVDFDRFFADTNTVGDVEGFVPVTSDKDPSKPQFDMRFKTVDREITPQEETKAKKQGYEGIVSRRDPANARVFDESKLVDLYGKRAGDVTTVAAYEKAIKDVAQKTGLENVRVFFNSAFKNIKASGSFISRTNSIAMSSNVGVTKEERGFFEQIAFGDKEEISKAEKTRATRLLYHEFSHAYIETLTPDERLRLYRDLRGDPSKKENRNLSKIDLEERFADMAGKQKIPNTFVEYRIKDLQDLVKKIKNLPEETLKALDDFYKPYLRSKQTQENRLLYRLQKEYLANNAQLNEEMHLWGQQRGLTEAEIHTELTSYDIYRVDDKTIYATVPTIDGNGFAVVKIKHYPQPKIKDFTTHNIFYQNKNDVMGTYLTKIRDDSKEGRVKLPNHIIEKIVDQTNVWREEVAGTFVNMNNDINQDFFKNKKITLKRDPDLTPQENETKTLFGRAIGKFQFRGVRRFAGDKLESFNLYASRLSPRLERSLAETELRITQGDIKYIHDKGSPVNMVRNTLNKHVATPVSTLKGLPKRILTGNAVFADGDKRKAVKAAYLNNDKKDWRKILGTEKEKLLRQSIQESTDETNDAGFPLGNQKIAEEYYLPHTLKDKYDKKDGKERSGYDALYDFITQEANPDTYPEYGLIQATIKSMQKEFNEGTALPDPLRRALGHQLYTKKKKKLTKQTRKNVWKRAVQEIQAIEYNDGSTASSVYRRQFDVVPEEFHRFYDDPAISLEKYFYGNVRRTAKARFFSDLGPNVLTLMTDRYKKVGSKEISKEGSKEGSKRRNQVPVFEGSEGNAILAIREHAREHGINLSAEKYDPKATTDPDLTRPKQGHSDFLEGIDLTSSVYKALPKLEPRGKPFSPETATELAEAINNYIIRKPSTKGLRASKDIIYAMTLSGFVQPLINIGDLATIMGNYGVSNTVLSAVKTVTGVGKKTRLKDVADKSRMREERGTEEGFFTSNTGEVIRTRISSAYTWMFNFTNNQIEGIGTEAAYAQAVKYVQKMTGNPRWDNAVLMYGEKHAKKLRRDLLDGKWNFDTQAFSTMLVARVLPTNYATQTRAYMRSNAITTRAPYILQSWVRHTYLNNIATHVKRLGDSTLDRATAVKVIMFSMFAAALGGVPREAIQKALMGNEFDFGEYLEEEALWNLIPSVNRWDYTEYSLTTNGLLDAVVGFAFPGISAVISQYPRDIFRAITGTQKGPSPLWKKLPYPFGVLYYGQDS